VLEEAATEHFDVPPRIDFSIAGVTYELSGALTAITNECHGSDTQDGNLLHALPR
jgi:hypothetical protein